MQQPGRLPLPRPCRAWSAGAPRTCHTAGPFSRTELPRAGCNVLPAAPPRAGLVLAPQPGSALRCKARGAAETTLAVGTAPWEAPVAGCSHNSQRRLARGRCVEMPAAFDHPEGASARGRWDLVARGRRPVAGGPSSLLFRQEPVQFLCASLATWATACAGGLQLPCPGAPAVKPHPV